MRERILYDVLLCFLVLYTPFWVYLPAVLIGIILFRLYGEAVVLALFIDYYYGPHIYTRTIFAFPFGLAAALLVLIAVRVREQLRIHL